MLRQLFGKVNMGIDLFRDIKNWPSVFLNYLKIIHNNELLFRFRNGNSLKLRNMKSKEDTSGLAMIWEIFIKRNYTPPEFEISPEDKVIDIGANIGIFSLYAAKKATKGKIYSYEPFTIHYKRMNENIKLNNLNNIISFNFAVCGKRGKRDLFINNQSSGMHSLIFDANSNKKITIECITLKDILEKNKIKECDFLKIDCEGAEYEILYYSSKKTLSRIKKIALEFDNIDKEKRNCFELKRFLEKNGFVVIIKGAREHQGILYAKRKV